MAEKLGGLVKIQNNAHRWSSQGGNGNKKILSQTNKRFTWNCNDSEKVQNQFGIKLYIM